MTKQKWTYLVVGYKPSSDDYCRGCLMASYSSDFVCEEYECEKDAIDAVIRLKTYEVGTGEEGFDDVEIYKVVMDENWTYDYSIVEDGILGVREQREKNRIEEIQKKRAEQQEYTKQQELLQLEKLKRKYENSRFIDE